MTTLRDMFLECFVHICYLIYFRSSLICVTFNIYFYNSSKYDIVFSLNLFLIINPINNFTENFLLNGE